MKSTGNKSEASLLRKKAIELLKNKVSGSDSLVASDDIRKLVHELEVHQIELEMQNEELQQSRSVAQEASDRYTELYDFAPSGYFTLSREGEIIELNISGANILGKERARLRKSKIGFFVSNDTKPVFNHFLEKVFSSKTKETCEVTLVTDAETPIYVYMTGIVFKNGEQCLVALIDITDRKQAEQDLIKAKEKAEEGDRLKSAFLANMSHEIRTPMNGILGFTELLKKPELSGERQQKYISMIEKGGVRMLNIINDIISISKVESGQMEVSVSETNINEQIEYIYTFFKSEAKSKGLQLFFNNSLPDNEAFLKTDREKVYAILTNLVKNAIKFTQTGSIHFGYTKKDKYLEFFVKDTGVGILTDQLQHVFERFKQGSESLTRNYEGAGLGLSIAKAYVGMLGGEIWVESEKGKGSTFYFTIPYNTEPVENNVLNDVISVEVSANQINNLKILIAEDDESSAMLQEEIIGSYCRDILHAVTGIEAIEASRSNPDIDLILMDIKMPEMDGFEATEQIRLFNKHVIIIAQTAYAFASDQEKALAVGCNDYISKPINQDLMIGLIGKYFSKS